MKTDLSGYARETISKHPRRIFDWQGPDFIQVLYRYVLQRDADASGWHSAYDFLAKGGSRFDLACSIVFSAEGRGHAQELTKLRWLLRWNRLRKLPLVFRFLASVLDIDRPGARARRERALMFALAALSKVLDEYLRQQEEEALDCLATAGVCYEATTPSFGGRWLPGRYTHETFKMIDSWT